MNERFTIVFNFIDCCAVPSGDVSANLNIDVPHFRRVVNVTVLFKTVIANFHLIKSYQTFKVHKSFVQAN